MGGGSVCRNGLEVFQGKAGGLRNNWPVAGRNSLRLPPFADGFCANACQLGCGIWAANPGDNGIYGQGHVRACASRSRLLALDFQGGKKFPTCKMGWWKGVGSFFPQCCIRAAQEEMRLFIFRQMFFVSLGDKVRPIAAQKERSIWK